MASISLEGLCKSFDKIVAVEDVNLEIRNGELVGLLGPSGCGKTTTLRCIAGLYIPDRGRVLFGNEDVTYIPAEKKDIGMVFQNYALFPHLTIFDNVAFGLRMRKTPKGEIARRVNEVLETVRLTGVGKRYPKQLSGGQQQRVALARAFVTRPRVLLLDEPLANLDAKLREHMRFFTKSIQRELGITTVYVTHDQAEAMVICDRIAVMFDGLLDQCGTPHDVYAEPITERVADFIGLANLVSVSVTKVLSEELCAVDAAQLDPEAKHIVARHNGDMCVGDETMLMIRPETVRLSLSSSEERDHNTLPVTVEQWTYMGNSIDYRVKTKSGFMVRIEEECRKTIELGSKAWAQFPYTSAWVIGRSDSEEVD